MGEFDLTGMEGQGLSDRAAANAASEILVQAAAGGQREFPRGIVANANNDKVMVADAGDNKAAAIGDGGFRGISPEFVKLCSANENAQFAAGLIEVSQNLVESRLSSIPVAV